ncbi:arginyl-tRNA synthetase [Haliangium ochraceum DSM 14365]|uniref:Arginine--tRNA ligase n=2 Tax=Haliangium ochraceum TaxID=80816 RepID=D0LW44_HALO1|nr:arginyl-tRNA synthetase [Haliangium ochraceum DSM 14365]
MPALMMDVLNPFAVAAVRAVAEALSLDPELFAVTAPPRPELGDFAVGCFPAAKALGQPPPKLAAQVAERFAPGEYLSEVKATGPFVNFRANRASALHFLRDATLAADGPALIPSSPGAGKTVCIDYSSPNISKHLAYHHIRSTVIGHALVNLHRAAGYRVVGINHLGDWGTTHGMLLAAHARWGAPEPLTVDGLNALYVRFRKEMADDPTLEEEGRRWFKKLEDGDAEARALWQRFREVSWAEFEHVYRILGIEFEDVRGESAYEDAIAGVLAMLEERGLPTVSEGALVVPLEDAGMPPLLLRKQDGATLYGTRDLAAAIYRHDTYDFARSLYVVDRGQSLHFRQLFEVLRRAGCDWAERCEHVPFGVVRVGGKKTGTRTGNVVLLKEVLAEAEQRAADVVRENNPEMTGEAAAETARMVGVGAVVFANLASQREKDVDFAWEQVLSVSGDSGPYVQYAHARCASILRKAEERGLTPGAEVDLSALSHETEWALARKLLDLGETVHRAAENNEPHLLSRYLLDLCAAFSRWYTAGNQDKSLRALVDDDAVARARITLVAIAGRVLARGLGLLGIEAPSDM